MFRHRVCCCLDHVDSKHATPPARQSLHFGCFADDRFCFGCSASFGTNPFDWVRAAVSPGLRKERSSREVDTAKRAKAEDASQSVFDTVAPEDERTQQKDSTPSPGVPKKSDHVRI